MKTTHHEVEIIPDEEDGNLLVRCPQCSSLQPLTPEDTEYRIYDNGGLYPMWVCMSPERKCEFEGFLFLVNWEQYIE